MTCPESQSDVVAESGARMKGSVKQSRMEKLLQVGDTVLHAAKIPEHWACGLMLVGQRRVTERDPEAYGLTKVALAHGMQLSQ